MKTKINTLLGAVLALLVLTLTSNSEAASVFHSDLPFTIFNPTPDVTVLHKNLAGYNNYGASSSGADILYSSEDDFWTFDLSSLPSQEGIVSAKVRLSLVLDDHYGTPKTAYVGRLLVNGDEVFSGAFTDLGVEHGSPSGGIFANWREIEFPLISLSPNYTVHILNDTPGGVFGDWIAVDYIDIELNSESPMHPPIANAGADITVASCAGPVSLDASLSSDPDGDPITWSWFDGSTLLATGVQPAVVLSAGTHTLTLVVTDSSAQSSTDTVVVTVNDFASDAIIWHQPLARNGASEDTDPSAGRTVKYRFKRGSTIPIQIHALNCDGADTTPNANVIGQVTVFGDSNCEGATDGNAEPIEFGGVGGSGGVMDKIDGHLKYNLDTKSLPTTTQCYILRVTVTDTSTGEEKFEEVLLQAK